MKYFAAVSKKTQHRSKTLTTMDDFPIDKIQISNASLSSILHRSISSIGDIHGYLFGTTSLTTTNILSDNPTPLEITPLRTTTITSFLSLPSHLPLPPPPSTPLGYFSSRRKTPLRPSLNDSTTVSTLSISTPIFLLLTTPFQDQLIHTYEYKAFRYKRGGNLFEEKSLEIVNIGPSFRAQYDSFSPNVALIPMMGCEEEVREEPKELGVVADGFGIVRLRKLMGKEYISEVEGLYEKMLERIDGLAKLVEDSNARVVEQEDRNMILRRRVAGLE